MTSASCTSDRPSRATRSTLPGPCSKISESRPSASFGPIGSTRGPSHAVDHVVHLGHHCPARPDRDGAPGTIPPCTSGTRSMPIGHPSARSVVSRLCPLTARTPSTPVSSARTRTATPSGRRPGRWLVRPAGVTQGVTGCGANGDARRHGTRASGRFRRCERSSRPWRRPRAAPRGAARRRSPGSPGPADGTGRARHRSSGSLSQRRSCS